MPLLSDVPWSVKVLCNGQKFWRIPALPWSVVRNPSSKVAEFASFNRISLAGTSRVEDILVLTRPSSWMDFHTWRDVSRVSARGNCHFAGDTYHRSLWKRARLAAAVRSFRNSPSDHPLSARRRSSALLLKLWCRRLPWQEIWRRC